VQNYPSNISREGLIAADRAETQGGALLKAFYLWTFILMFRPQDFLSFLVPLRPALAAGLIVIVLFAIHGLQLLQGVTLNKQMKMFLALVLVMIAGIPFAYHRGVAFMFLFTQYVNVILYVAIFYVVVRRVEVIRNVLFFSCLGTALYALVSFTGGHVIRSRLAFGSAFDPNDLAFFLVSFLPFSFVFLTHDNQTYRKAIGLCNLTITPLVILLTGSRAGFVALVSVFILLLFHRSRTVKMGHKLTFMVIGAVIIFSSAATIDFERFQTILHPKEDYNWNDEWGRKSIWKTGLRLMIEHPFTGVGLSCFNMAIGQDREERDLIPKWQAPHSALIQVGTETGVGGFLLFIMMSLTAFRWLRTVRKRTRNDKTAELAEMGAIGFVGLIIGAMFLSQGYSIYWAFYIVLSAVLYRALQEELGESIPRAPAIEFLK
jgi:O-antigen ligase